MFSKPIRHVKLKGFSDLANYSLSLFEFKLQSERKQYCIYQENVVYVTEEGQVYVTPIRPEVCSILKENGYTEAGFSIPYKGKEFVEKLNYLINSDGYKWLIKIAEEEIFYYMFEQAHYVAKKKGIKEVEVKREFVEMYADVSMEEKKFGEYLYTGMLDKKFKLLSENNVGTYIRVNEDTILLCDEYGRTYYIKIKVQDYVNDFINQLIDAGYTRNRFPWEYVYKGDRLSIEI